MEVGQAIKPAGDLGSLDEALVSRSVGAANVLRHLKSPLTIPYRIGVVEDLFPLLCERLGRARAAARAGNRREAGREYEVLLAASQLLQLELGVVAAADYADQRRQPSPEIEAVLTAYVDDAAPLWDAILEGDHARLTVALSANAALYAKWVAFLEQWTRRLDAAATRVEIAHVVWDGLLASIAAIETAGALADLAASTTPPTGGSIAALAGGGSLAIVDSATIAETVAALRHLIATGALDAAFVAALARMGSTATPPASSHSRWAAHQPPSWVVPTRTWQVREARLIIVRPRL